MENKYIKYINLGDPIAVLGFIDSVLGSVDLWRGNLGFNVAVISVLSLLSNSSIASINAESTRTESKNNFLLVYNYLSVILIILVAVYSIISLAIVSITPIIRARWAFSAYSSFRIYSFFINHWYNIMITIWIKS